MKNNSWCVCDTETLKEFKNIEEYQYNKDVLDYLNSSNYDGRRIFLLSFYCNDLNVVFDVYNQQEKIIDLLFNVNKKYIYFHNLSYDGVFIIKLLQKLGFKQKDTLAELNSNYYDYMIIGSKYFKIDIKYNGEIIHILDSSRFLPFKVKALPKLFKLDGMKKTWQGKGYDEKWMYDYVLLNKECEELDEFKDYCINDSKIVYHALIKLFDFCKEQNLPYDLHKYTTLGSYALDTYLNINPYMDKLIKLPMKNFKDIKIPMIGTNDCYNLIRTLYKGGLCEVNSDYSFKEITTKDNVHSYDINSAYPAILNNELIPCSFNPLVGLEYVSDIVVFYVSSEELKANSNLRFLFNDSFKYKLDDNAHPKAFGYGSIFCLFNEEYEWMKKYYDGEVKELIRIPTYGCKADLNGYVDKFYKLKKQFKLDGNKAFETITKLFINSLTGKFGQKPSYKNRVIFSDDEYIDVYKKEKVSDKYWKKVKKTLKTNNSMDDTYYVAKKYESQPELKIDDEINNFLMVSYITMKTRTKIISFIDKIGVDRWIYTDTDSLKIFGTLDDEKLIGLELGQFKDEGQADIAMFYHPKAYFWNNEFTFAGVDKDITKTINYKDVKDGYIIKNGRKQPMNVKDGIELIDIDYQVGECYVF